MSKIVIKCQEDWDKLPKQFDKFTRLDITGSVNISLVPLNARAVLWENARAVLRGNASAELRENASAELWENARAVLRGNASAELWENASAELWENAVAWCRSSLANVVLNGFSVLMMQVKCKIKIKSKYAHVQKIKKLDWFETNGITKTKNLTFFKRVSKDWKTQEGTENETVWSLGATLEHPAWNPKEDECGRGKFHACSKPYFCDEFRDIQGDRYIALKVALADTYAWPDPGYPHKIAFRKGTVLYECDAEGRKL